MGHSVPGGGGVMCQQVCVWVGGDVPGGGGVSFASRCGGGIMEG